MKLRCLEKIQEGEEQDCVVFVKVYRMEAWNPGAPWRCGGIKSTPSFARLHPLERGINAGVTGSTQQKNTISLSPFLQKKITQALWKDSLCSGARFRVHLAVSCSHVEVQLSQQTLP